MPEHEAELLRQNITATRELAKTHHDTEPDIEKSLNEEADRCEELRKEELRKIGETGRQLQSAVQSALEDKNKK